MACTPTQPHTFCSEVVTRRTTSLGLFTCMAGVGSTRASLVSGWAWSLVRGFEVTVAASNAGVRIRHPAAPAAPAQLHFKNFKKRNHSYEAGFTRPVPHSQ